MLSIVNIYSLDIFKLLFLLLGLHVQNAFSHVARYLLIIVTVLPSAASKCILTDANDCEGLYHLLSCQLM